MKFNKVIEHIPKVNDLKRIASARLYDTTRLDQDQLRSSLIEKMRHYADGDSLIEAYAEALLHDDRDIRVITPIIIGEVLLQQHECSLTQSETEEEVIKWQQSVIDESKGKDKEYRKIHNFGFFQFVLEAAWANYNSISRDEKNLIDKIRSRLRINEREYRVAEAQLSQFPKAGNEIHQREEINKVRIYLQKSGMLLTYRNSDGCDCDVIPDEMISGLRRACGVEIRHYGYRQLITYKAVRKKDYLRDVLQKGEVSLSGNPQLSELQELCVEHVSPRVLLGGISERDGLEKSVLEKWCKDLAVPSSGSKNDLIQRIIDHYDGLIERPSEDTDNREIWFEHYEKFARRDRAFLRAQELIDKDLEMEANFEKATDYLFEVLLGHTPLPLPGSEQPDGCLALRDGLLLWDNKSKETDCNLKDHLAQFDRYFSARKDTDKVYSLMVIAPSYTAESHQVALLHEIQTGNKIALITANELKEVALKWSASIRKDDPFNLRFFTTTGRFNPDILSAVI